MAVQRANATAHVSQSAQLMNQSVDIYFEIRSRNIPWTTTRGSPAAKPWALVRGKPGAQLELHVEFLGGRKHLPVVTLRRAA